MSQVLTVPTHFSDLGELSEGFLDRVEQDTLILYGPVAYEDGSEIEFAVLLADGSPALEGMGRVRAAVDGGADRVPETRYDVVVEALELDGRSEVVFERLVLARQAVSDRPAASDAEPLTGDVSVAPADDESSDEPVVEEVELAADEAFSVPPDEVYSLAPEDAEPVTVPPDEEAPDTVPPEASAEDDDDQDEYDDDPPTVIAAVDAEAMMAEADLDAVSASEPASEAVSAPESEPAPAAVSESVPVSEPAPALESEPVLEAELGEDDDVLVEASMSEASDSDEEAVADQEGALDPEYAFEHGIAAEPQVGMPVPVPSMAAPPEAPPAPPTLRLADPPEGLTRPSLAQVEEALFSTDGEVSDVHTTGLFVYENGLPIPSRPPLPDPNGPRTAATGEANEGYDVEESEPPEADDDEYEEVRLSDFAEAAEEG
jgi:hypothetical protein